MEADRGRIGPRARVPSGERGRPGGLSIHYHTVGVACSCVYHLRVAMIVLFLLIARCGDAFSQDATPYAFGGIVLDSSEAELPETYKVLFDSSDCRLDNLRHGPVRLCGKNFQPSTLPGLPLGVKNSVYFSLNYVSGRLQQIGFRFHRDDYETFVSFLIREHGKPLFSKPVVIFTAPNTETVKAIEYTWHRGRFSIATYPLLWDSKRSSYESAGVVYAVIGNAR